MKKAVCAVLGLTTFLLVVNADFFSAKELFGYVYLIKCKDFKREDLSLYVGLLEKCDKELVKLDEIVNGLKDDKTTRIKLFKGFCKLYPELHSCGESALNILKKCLNPVELKFVTIATELQKFTCSKDGKLGTGFIADGGLECLETKTPKIQNCMAKYVNERFLESNLTFCKDIGVIRKCVKTNMETCPSKSNVNAFETFSKIVNNRLECKN